MAYVPVAGDILRVTIAATYPDSQVQETNHNYAVLSPGATDPRPSLGPAVYALYLANWLGRIGPSASMYGWKVSVVNRHPNPAPVSAVATNIGSGTDPNLATQTRQIITWRTALAGPGYRGRTFLFSNQTADISTTASPVAAAITAAAALASAVAGVVTAGGSSLALVIAKRHAGPPVTWTVEPVTSIVARNKFGTQRKSGQYGRANVGPW